MTALPGPSRSAIFGALADPTRREIVELLARRGEATATQLSAEFPISRQAVAKHLGALSAAGLLITHRVGREQRYVLQPSALDAPAAWMQEVGDLWDQRLAALSQHLARRA
ncbi:MAG: ArsR/SmtB family transcription factor [Acidimicrobiales bacterium]